jgi:hypothetical protein
MRINIDSEWMITKDKSFLNELHYTLLCNHYCSKLRIIFLKERDFSKLLSEFHLTLAVFQCKERLQHIWHLTSRDCRGN